MQHWRGQAKWDMTDVLAMSALQPLQTGFVPWSSWSLRPAALLTVLNEVAHHDRRAVVEFGSGASTWYLAALLRERGGRLVSYEHDARWVSHVRRLVDENGLSDVADIVEAPLVPWRPPDDVSQGLTLPDAWYDGAAVQGALPQEVDLVLVDGPPAGEHPHILTRFPALGAVRGVLSPTATVILDDVARPAELHTAIRWQVELEAELDVIDRLGIAVFRRDGDRTVAF